jgi:hypothetical protein
VLETAVDQGEHGNEVSMIGSQLGRMVLAGSETSPDEQQASPGEDGGYDELMVTIDRLLQEDGGEPGLPAG